MKRKILKCPNCGIDLNSVDNKEQRGINEEKFSKILKALTKVSPPEKWH
jgi:hypothetical protein